MSEKQPTDQTDDTEPAVIKSQKDPKNSTDSHVAGHGEVD